MLFCGPLPILKHDSRKGWDLFSKRRLIFTLQLCSSACPSPFHSTTDAYHGLAGLNLFRSGDRTTNACHLLRVELCHDAGDCARMFSPTPPAAPFAHLSGANCYANIPPTIHAASRYSVRLSSGARFDLRATLTVTNCGAHDRLMRWNCHAVGLAR